MIMAPCANNRRRLVPVHSGLEGLDADLRENVGVAFQLVGPGGELLSCRKNAITSAYCCALRLPGLSSGMV